MLKIEITDTGVIDAFNRLIAFGENPQGALMGIGQAVAEFTKTRFNESADPYGNPWAPNSDTTLRAALHHKEKISGNIFSKRKGKEGSLNKPGLNYLAGKKPLIGETGNLSNQFHYTVIGDDSVVVSSLMEYAATQQFGAKQGEFGRDKRNHPIPWGDIPARPFFPDESRGLPDELNRDISDVLRAALESAING